MTAVRSTHGVRHLSSELVSRAIPATVFGVHDLNHGDLTALKVVTSDVDEPMDATTVIRLLHVLREHLEMLAFPLVIDLAFTELAGLPEARNFSRRPLIAVIEADELFDRPAAFVDAISTARQLGWEIGLRKVGASYASLAAMAVIEPSVILLDHSYVVDATGPLGLETIQAVSAYSQATGASVLAGPLTTSAQLQGATRLLATLGWGSAVHSPAVTAGDTYELDLFTPPLRPTRGQSCWDLAASRHRPLATNASVLEALSETIETQALAAGPSTVVCAGVLEARLIHPARWRRYDNLARAASSVNVLAEGATHGPRVGATTVELHTGDPMRNEWVTLVLGPVSAVLLVARIQPAHIRGGTPDFTFVLSYERELVAQAARSIFTRIGA